MTPAVLLITFIIPAYLLGSVPFGLLVGKTKGIDPRTAGSGNIGATNVGRLLGRKFFFLVFALDLLKSFVPMVVASIVANRVAPSQRGWALYCLWFLVGAAAVFGHMFSVFLKFKGGKGVSASAGVMLGLIPYYTLPGLLGVGVFVLVLKLSRFVSLASMIGASSFPIFYVVIGLAFGWPVFGAQLPLLVFAVVMVVLIVYRHRSNIGRLRAGTESKVTKRAA